MGQNARQATLLAAIAATPMMASGADAPQPSDSHWKNGAEAYRKVCAYCHESGVAPVLLGRALPPPLIKVFVRNGNLAMPSFRDAEIDDATLAQLAEYISRN